MTSSPKPLRVVIDTGIVVSSVLVRHGHPNRLRAWQHGQVTLVTAPSLVAGIDRTISSLALTISWSWTAIRHWERCAS